MIKAIALLLSILVLGKFAEAAGFNFHDSFGDSDDIEGGSVSEAMNYEDLDIPSDETNNNFICRLFNYATSGIYRLASAFEEFNGTSSEIPESNRAEAAPWADQLESKTIKLASGQIPVTEALALLPQLLMHFNVIESANTIIKTNEIIIAALKMRSIIPDYIIDEEDPDEKEFKRLIGPLNFNSFQAAFSEIKFIKPYLQLALKSKKKNVPTYYTLLSNHLENLLFRLANESNISAIDEIKNFDFNGPKSLAEVVAEKESEMAQALADSLESVRQAQAILRSNSQASPDAFTSSSLAVICVTVDEIKTFMTLLAELESPESEPEKQAELEKKLIFFKYTTALRIEKLAEVLEVI